MTVKAVAYNSDDVYLVSNSQMGTLTNCPKQWYNNYFLRRVGMYNNHFPFSFGLFIHTLLEDGFNIDNEYDRQLFEANYIENRGFVPSKRRKQYINKQHLNVSSYFDKYEFIKGVPGTELELAIEVSLDNFPSELTDVLSSIKLANGDVRSFSGFGYRGIIDFYGIDSSTGEKALVDWKTGKKGSQWEAGYDDQLNKYAYLAEVNGLDFDVGRVEYVLHRDTKHIRTSAEKGKELIFNDLNQIAKALIDAHNGEEFKAIPSDQCNICLISFNCRKHEFSLVEEFYVV